MSSPNDPPAVVTVPHAGEGVSARGTELMVLGRGQDGGLPQLGCRKPCCTQARRDGRSELPAALGLLDHSRQHAHLIEATPAIERQASMLLERLDARPPDAPILDGLLLTHAHIGHYLGLAQLGREVAAADHLPVHVSERVARFLRENQPWAQLLELGQVQLRIFEPGQSFMVTPEVWVEPIPVPHRDEFFDTMAFAFRGADSSVLFLPDIDRWEDPSIPARFIEDLLATVDVAYLDGTFYDDRELPGRDLSVIPHPLVVDSMKRLAPIARERPGMIRFIHLNHTNPLLHDEALVDRLAADGFGLARTGECVSLWVDG
ncbi:MAG: MBL fold metallo-hydrolase [Planctomycetota bacterium]|nr:MBL fold metallo-hydrolase [Planctomycetota bacterium]